MNAEQLTIVCLIKAKETTKQQVREELKNLAALTHTEKENINYDLHISKDDDRLFIIYENWKNQAALDNHINQPYFKNFLAKTSELLECPFDVKICRMI
jgi:quinol monooxygenase YgiN